MQGLRRGWRGAPRVARNLTSLLSTCSRKAKLELSRSTQSYCEMGFFASTMNPSQPVLFFVPESLKVDEIGTKADLFESWSTGQGGFKLCVSSPPLCLQFGLYMKMLNDTGWQAFELLVLSKQHCVEHIHATAVFTWRKNMRSGRGMYPAPYFSWSCPVQLHQHFKGQLQCSFPQSERRIISGRLSWNKCCVFANHCRIVAAEVS